VKDEITTMDFTLETDCEPVSGFDFTWLPVIFITHVAA
jgi:hypothetical protein